MCAWLTLASLSGHNLALPNMSQAVLAAASSSSSCFPTFNKHHPTRIPQVTTPKQLPPIQCQVGTNSKAQSLKPQEYLWQRVCHCGMQYSKVVIISAIGAWLVCDIATVSHRLDMFWFRIMLFKKSNFMTLHLFCSIFYISRNLASKDCHLEKPNGECYILW